MGFELVNLKLVIITLLGMLSFYLLYSLLSNCGFFGPSFVLHLHPHLPLSLCLHSLHHPLLHLLPGKVPRFKPLAQSLYRELALIQQLLRRGCHSVFLVQVGAAYAECHLQLCELVPLTLLWIESLAQLYQLTYSLLDHGILGTAPLDLPPELLIAHPIVCDGLLSPGWVVLPLMEFVCQQVNGLGDLGQVCGGPCLATQGGEI